MARPARSSTLPDDPLLKDRAWRYCVLCTLRDLKRSITAHRILSAPNLYRLFDRRWHAAGREEAVRVKGSSMGRVFLNQYYRSRQPFKSQAHSNHH